MPWANCTYRNAPVCLCSGFQLLESFSSCPREVSSTFPLVASSLRIHLSPVAVSQYRPHTLDLNVWPWRLTSTFDLDVWPRLWSHLGGCSKCHFQKWKWYFLNLTWRKSRSTFLLLHGTRCFSYHVKVKEGEKSTFFFGESLMAHWWLLISWFNSQSLLRLSVLYPTRCPLRPVGKSFFSRSRRPSSRSRFPLFKLWNDCAQPFWNSVIHFTGL